MEYLGPQLIQLIKGYRYLLSDGSANSLKHSLHTEISGDRWVKPASSKLFNIKKSLKLPALNSLILIEYIWASGGQLFLMYDKK